MKFFLIAGAAGSLISIALGAFGAHGLKSVLHEDSLTIWKTAVQYQMFHSLALLVFSILYAKLGRPDPVGWCFIIGILLFSGSLYLLAVTGSKWFGAITPFGGICFLVGWIWMIFLLIKMKESV